MFSSEIYDTDDLFSPARDDMFVTIHRSELYLLNVYVSWEPGFSSSRSVIVCHYLSNGFGSPILATSTSTHRQLQPGVEGRRGQVGLVLVQSSGTDKSADYRLDVTYLGRVS